MNIRYTVLCERLRTRARIFRFADRRPRTNEELLQATEERLEFTLPLMLRKLYLEDSNGGDIFAVGYTMAGVRPAFEYHDPSHFCPDEPSDLERSRSRSGQRWPIEMVAALREHPGPYIWSDWWPEAFVGLTGHLYLEDGDRVSFCSPTVEDWLERELDAPLAVQVQYFPHEELRAVLEAERPGERQQQPSMTKQAETPDETEVQRETQRLREENLGYEEEDPSSKLPESMGVQRETGCPSNMRGGKSRKHGFSSCAKCIPSWISWRPSDEPREGNR